MSRKTVAVVGATGYGGAEIVRLLAGHPVAQVVIATSERNPGKLLSDEAPWLSSQLELTRFDVAATDVDVVFLCQEAGFAMEHAKALARRSVVVDLSADFRLEDRALYEATYDRPHASPETVAVYGLPELVDSQAIANARIIANPGCYPTASLLALAPLVRAGLVTGTPVIDAKSGVSGAGRSRKETDYLFSELSGGFRAYGAVGHRHTPEIEQLAGIPVRFTPHLLPQARGIHATLHVPISAGIDRDTVLNVLTGAYEGRPFVRVVGSPPSTKQVLGSNRCDLWADVDARTGHAVICSVIDNLTKGAAGQAIQNMNIALGLPEATGLPLHGVWP
jgi:N-acetyl-gamma-glutamyl-phosphate reductase